MTIIHTSSLTLTCMLLLAAGCAKSQPTLASNAENVLIVYLTRTRNTEVVAQIIQKEVGGRLLALELVNPYPQNYRAQVDQVVRENETGFLPPLKTRVDSFEKYNVVFIGFPTWDMSMPPPMKSFLHQYDLSGKTVIPFNTNAGYGVGSGFETVKQLCPRSRVLEGYATKGGIEREGVLFVMEGKRRKLAEDEIKAWLRRIKVLK